MKIRKKRENVNDIEFVKDVLCKLNAKRTSLEKTMHLNIQCFEKIELDACKLVPKNARGKNMANRWIILNAEIEAKNQTLKRFREFSQ